MPAGHVASMYRVKGEPKGLQRFSRYLATAGRQQAGSGQADAAGSRGHQVQQTQQVEGRVEVRGVSTAAGERARVCVGSPSGGAGA